MSTPHRNQCPHCAQLYRTPHAWARGNKLGWRSTAVLLDILASGKEGAYSRRLAKRHGMTMASLHTLVSKLRRRMDGAPWTIRARRDGRRREDGAHYIVEETR